MNKQELKNILMNLRTSKNESQANYLLGKIDMMSDDEISKITSTIGNNKENIIDFLSQKLAEKTANYQSEEHFPINKMFTYGIGKRTVHLHIPRDLHDMIAQKGFRNSIDTVNLYLLDALNKLKTLKDNGFYKLNNVENIFMISPLLSVKKELNFLEDLNFQAEYFSQQELNDTQFVSNNKSAILATQIFGTNKKVGTASINFDTISSPEWQSKKEEIIKEFSRKGITLEADTPEKQ